MSQENVEIVRAFYEAWNAGDMSVIADSYDPNIVVRYAEGWPEGLEPIMGREAVVRQFEQQREAFDADTLELLDVIDVGDRVVVRQVWRAVGSGPDVNIEVTSVATLRKGKRPSWSSSGITPKPSKPWGWRIRPYQTEGHEVGAAGFEPATSRV
jgi:ketosteroid isomerase-like protein